MQLPGARFKEVIAVECPYGNAYRNPLSARRADRPQLNWGVGQQRVHPSFRKVFDISFLDAEPELQEEGCYGIAGTVSRRETVPGR